MDELISSIKDIIDRKAKITRLTFGFILSAPITLTSLFYAIVAGVTRAENSIIIYGIFLFIYDIIYIIIFYYSKDIPTYVFSFFRINDKNKEFSAENIFFDNEYIFRLKEKEIVLEDLERLDILDFSTNIVKMKLINLIGIFLTIFTLIVIALVS